MIRWPQFVAGIAVAMIGVAIAFAQEQPKQKQEMQAPSKPPADRELSRSRFSDFRTASRPPPIVSKANASSAERDSGAAVSSKRLTSETDYVAPKVTPSFTPADPRNTKELLNPTTIVAMVGGYHIITGDVLGDVNLSIPPEAKLQLPPEEYEQLQVVYLRAILNASIETKILFCDFMRQERAKEMIVKLESTIATRFDEQVNDAFAKVIAADTMESREELRKIDSAIRRIADLMVREQLSTMGEVDVALNSYGTSLVKERRRYAERYAAFMVLQNLVSGKKKKEITRERQLEYYQAHLPDFDRAPRCKWEKLSVRTSQFKNDEEAWEAIADMGNRVYREGAKLSAVARQSSQTADAADGGLHDWTGKNSLRSEVINEAIFKLPVGQLSDILRDDEGLHIIRVIEREDGGYQPFSDPKTQEIIKRKLEEEQSAAVRQAHVAKLKREIAVWNIFDELNDEEGRAE